ncbi:MAG: DUF3800 domain-containing protein [Pseudomonadota bacterium]
MEYIVYCDESRHAGMGHHPFMAIGSLWMPRAEKAALTGKFKNLCYSLDLHGEVKWSKTSRVCLESYKQLVDFFFNEKALRFRVIVVNQNKLDLEKYHDGDQELGFYKFYDEMLIKWIEDGNEYLILLDFKKNKGADRHKTLKTVIENKLKGKAVIKDLTIIDSAQTPLSQLCDLLTGAVAADWCGLTPGRPKADLAAYIASKCGYSCLRIESTLPEPCSKFNIFNIRLS